MPSPALNVKYLSPASPSPIDRFRPAASTSLITPIAAVVSAGSPSARASTLPPPPGMTASSGPVPEGLLPLARKAVAACPTLALLLNTGD